MLHHLLPLQHGHEDQDPEGGGQDFAPGAQNRCRYCENKLLLMFPTSLWLFMSYPSGFVNTCVCTLLFVGSGCRQRYIYCIYEDFKKSKPTCKISLLLFKTKKAHVLLNVPTFCQNVHFLGGRGEAETTVALCCCDGKKQNKNQQQTIMKHKVCLLVGGKGGQDKPKPAEIMDSARMFPCFFLLFP